MTCLHCKAAVQEGAYLCRKCVQTLDVALGNIAAYHGDFETIRARERAQGYAPSGKGGSKSAPLGMDLRFDVDGRGTRIENAARNSLSTWVRHCVELWSLAYPKNTWSGMCGFLQGILTAIAGQDWSDELMRDMLATEREFHAFVFPPPLRIYAGTCLVCAIVGDHSPLYAREGDAAVTCPADDCGMEYDVAECRETMRATVDGALCTAAEIAGLATYLDLLEDREKTRKRINLWNHRGVIQAHSLNHDAEPLYVFGEVVSMILEADAAKRARGAKRAPA